MTIFHFQNKSEFLKPSKERTFAKILSQATDSEGNFHFQRHSFMMRNPTLGQKAKRHIYFRIQNTSFLLIAHRFNTIILMLLLIEKLIV